MSCYDHDFLKSFQYSSQLYNEAISSDVSQDENDPFLVERDRVAMQHDGPWLKRD